MNPMTNSTGKYRATPVPPAAPPVETETAPATPPVETETAPVEAKKPSPVGRSVRVMAPRRYWVPDQSLYIEADTITECLYDNWVEAQVKAGIISLLEG